jgi:hypothetical protein
MSEVGCEPTPTELNKTKFTDPNEGFNVNMYS